MATWTTPKTDWKASDYFEASDYNRIVGNLIYLKDKATTLYSGIVYSNMVTSKSDGAMFYAKEMNLIENNLAILNSKTYNKNIGTKKTYSPNQATPTYDEFNRIENACVEIRKQIDLDLALIPRFTFRLGNAKGVRE